jgi:hypothetical protein
MRKPMMRSLDGIEGLNGDRSLTRLSTFGDYLTELPNLTE